MTHPTISRSADLLTVGDRIAEGFVVPTREYADVAFVHPYRLGTSSWVFVAYLLPGGAPDSDRWLADAMIPLDALADPAGLGYSREPDDDPTPVSPARVQPHYSAMVGPPAGSELVDVEGEASA